MHDFQKVARAHHQAFGRAAEETTTSSSKAATTAAATTSSSSSSATSTKASSTTSSSSASTTAKAATTSSSTPSTTSASSTTPLINLSSILEPSTSKASTTTSSSTSSTPATTSAASTTAKAAATSALTTSAARGFTSTATLTSSGTASAASSTSSDSAASSSSGLSGAATGGIVAACIFAGLALLIFAVRKTFIQRRKRKRNTWGAGVYPDINDKFTDGGSINDVAPPIPEKTPSSTTFLGVEPRTPVWAPPRPVSPNPNPYYVQPPQPSYNNAFMDAAPSLAPPGTGYAVARPASANSFRPQSSANEMAMVKVLYIPTLPDELSITTGEVVHVVKAYDDGWALCANARGEQGVVPLECLDRTAQTQADRLSTGFGQQESASDWRNMKRISSLSTQQPHY